MCVCALEIKYSKWLTNWHPSPSQVISLTYLEYYTFQTTL